MYVRILVFGIWFLVSEELNDSSIYVCRSCYCGNEANHKWVNHLLNWHGWASKSNLPSSFMQCAFAVIRCSISRNDAFLAWLAGSSSWY